MYPPLPLPQCCCKHCLRDDLMRKNQHCTGGGGGHKKRLRINFYDCCYKLLTAYSKLACPDITCQQLVYNLLTNLLQLVCSLLQLVCF